MTQQLDLMKDYYQSCVWQNRKTICAHGDLCCRACAEKNCEYRCRDNPRTCTYADGYKIKEDAETR